MLIKWIVVLISRSCRRIEQAEYRSVLETSVAEFVERIRKRAVQKRLEMAKDVRVLYSCMTCASC